MSDAFSFTLLKTDGGARRGEIVTPHGRVQTPAFMPVGTQGTVKGLTPDIVRATGAEIVLGNTYHLMLRPVAERIAALGGLHAFMHWPLPILTDSGGFQVMSLSALRRLEEHGVTFRSHLDGAMVELTPERAIEIQALLGADISMQLDECLRLPAPPEEIRRAMELSLRWGERSKRAFESRAREGYALFGIVQGGDDTGLRRQSARAQGRQRPHLKAAAIGQDRQRPVHEGVQAAERGDALGAGPQHQVISIAEHDFGAGRGYGLRQQALHGALRADRHEGRRLHAPMRRDDLAAARGAVGGEQAEGEGAGHYALISERH